MSKVLEVKNLSKSFEIRDKENNKISLLAVNDISFSIEKGEIVGFLGPNGAGKTTAISMLLGTLTPTSGSISYFGKYSSAQASEVRARIGFASSYASMPKSLTVSENLDIFGRLYGLDSIIRKKRIHEMLQLFDIEHLQNTLTRVLSAGQKARLNLAKAFIAHPKLVFLDEPTAALDPDIRQDICALVLAYSKQYETTFLYTSHDMREIELVCDRVLIMQQGKIVADGKPKELAASIADTRLKLGIAHVTDDIKKLVAKHTTTFNAINGILEIILPSVAIPLLLHDFAQEHIQYTSIDIEHPNLESFFIKLSQSGKTKKKEHKT